METKSNLIGAIVLTSNYKSNFDHYDDDEGEDEQVQGMIVERIDDGTTTIYLVMDTQGRVCETDYSEIEKIISFGGTPSEYLKKRNTLS